MTSNIKLIGSRPVYGRARCRPGSLETDSVVYQAGPMRALIAAIVAMQDLLCCYAMVSSPAALRATAMASDAAAEPFLHPHGSQTETSASTALRAEQDGAAGDSSGVGMVFMHSAEHADWEKQMHFCKLLEVYCLKHRFVDPAFVRKHFGEGRVPRQRTSCVSYGEANCKAEGLGWLFQAISETRIEKADELAPKALEGHESYVGRGTSNLCGGITEPGQFHLSTVHKSVLQIDVDTSKCGFDSTPQYVVNLFAPRQLAKHGLSTFHGTLSGSTTIAVSAANGFRVFVRDMSRSAAVLLRVARTHSWQLTWIGDTGKNSGNTAPGHTGWRAGSAPGVLVADVDTSACEYARTPVYFASLQGHPTASNAMMSWSTQGGSVVRLPTVRGFRVMINIPHRAAPGLAAAAEKESWIISWIGVSRSDPRIGVVASTDWRARGEHAAELHLKCGTSGVMDIRHKHAQFYVASLTTNAETWHAVGDGLVHETRTGYFDYVLTRPVCCGYERRSRLTEAQARAQSWRVQYIAFNNQRGKIVRSSTVGTGHSKLCGDTTLPGQFVLAAEYSDAIQIDVDTSACRFVDIPRYAVSLVQQHSRDMFNFNGRLSGTTSIAVSSRSGFRVILWDPLKSAYELLRVSRTQGWQLSWIGDSGSNTGITRAGSTGWTQGANMRTIYADVDTRASHFHTKPRYFPALHGAFESKNSLKHWRTQGADIVYRPTRTGFRIYITAPHHLNNGLAALAEADGWCISWIGVPAFDRRSDMTHLNWRMDHRRGQNGLVPGPDTPTDLFATVGTKERGFLATPSYVVSLTVDDLSWRASGDLMLFSPTTSQFQIRLGTLVDGTQVYPGKHVTLKYARQRKMGVNYVGYTLPVNMPGGNPGAAVMSLLFNVTLRDESIESFPEWKQQQFVRTLTTVLGMLPSSADITSCKAMHFTACSNDGGCAHLDGVNLGLRLTISAKYCALQGLQNCDPLVGRLGLAEYVIAAPFKKMLVAALQNKGVRIRISEDNLGIENTNLVENRKNWGAKPVNVQKGLPAWAKKTLTRHNDLTKILFGFFILGSCALLSINVADRLFRRRFDIGKPTVLPSGSSSLPSYLNDRDTPSPSPEREHMTQMQEYGQPVGDIEQKHGLLRPTPR